MVKTVRITGALYIIFCLYIVFLGQARCSSGSSKLTGDEKVRITNLDVVPATQQPKRWKIEQKNPFVLRSHLEHRCKALFEVTVQVPLALKSVELLKVRNRVAPVDHYLYQLSGIGDSSHDGANRRIQGTAYRARGVPVYTSSSYSSSGHK